MAQHYDNAVKYVMLEHSQECAEFVVGTSNITAIERLETEEPILPDTVQPLQSTLETIDSLQRLKALLLVALQVQRLEAFMESLNGQQHKHN